MVETLYFKTYYSYLLGNLQDTKMYYELLRDEVSHSGVSSLNSNKLLELKNIKQALTTGSLGRQGWVETEAPDGVGSLDKEPVAEERALVRMIHYEGFKDLKTLFSADVGFHLANIEHPCGDLGWLDMLYMDGRIAYPIEVKRGTGQHSLIGQIAKYDLAIRLKLHYKFYEEVQSATICNDYHPFVLQELKKLGIRTFIYQRNSGPLKILEI